jgi:pimeloyl-ACP methyl ester carboxylesterase
MRTSVCVCVCQLKLSQSMYVIRPSLPCTSLQEARQGLGVESDFVLAGHSLGGFLSARYAMKYPDSGGHLSLSLSVAVAVAVSA